MKTDDLITMIATQAGPASKMSVTNRLLPAGVLGGLIATATALGLIGLIPGAMFAEPGPWIKIAYSSTLVVAAACLFVRLGQPGASGQRATFALVAAVLLMTCVGALAYLATPEAEREAALLGHSWLVCPWSILGLSLPVMACSFWAMRGYAPTNPVKAGAACGLFSGSVAALAYALACTEPAASFVAVWYTLGIALCSTLGAVLGPRLLRW